MTFATRFIPVKVAVEFRLPYDFHIARYPVTLAADGRARVGVAEDGELWRATLAEAMAFCDALSRRAGLPLVYAEGVNQIDYPQRTRRSFRLPSPLEWEFAAHGWSGQRTGDYFAVQKRLFRIPGLDFPVSEEECRLFGQGYSQISELPANHIGIHGMLGYAREWCSPVIPGDDAQRCAMRWEEYYTNYDNDIGYQTNPWTADAGERLPFRVVLPD